MHPRPTNRPLRHLLFRICAGTLVAAAVSLHGADDSAPKLLSTKGGGGWSTLAELKLAAAAGNPRACAQLGEMTLRGTDVPKDVPRAIALLEKGARGGSADAAFRLGMIYDDGDGVKNWQDKCSNTPKGAKLLTDDANKGCADGQFDDSIYIFAHQQRGTGDNDGDGIANQDDFCTNTPKGLKVHPKGSEFAGCSEGQMPNHMALTLNDPDKRSKVAPAVTVAATP